MSKHKKLPTQNPKTLDRFAALHERNYLFFLLGWIFSATGLTMQATALAWEVYERTGDPLALGLTGLARALPNVMLALPAGQIVDMLNRKRVLIATQVAFALASLLLVGGSFAWEHGLFGTGHLGLYVIYFLVGLTGCARVFNGPSRSSLLPLLFSEGAAGPVFHNAVTWNSGAFQFAATLGPLLAGWLIARCGCAWPVYGVTAFSCLWCALMLINIAPYGDNVTDHFTKTTAFGGIYNLIRPSHLLPGMLEGVKHVWRERVVFGAIVLDLFAVLLGGATALLPVYAKDILQVGPVGLGLLKAAPYIGAMIMALVLTGRPPFKRSGPLLLATVACFGICTIIFGISTNIWISLLALAALGAFDNISVVIRNVLVSVRTPDHLRGRVAAVNSVFIECSNEVGGFESGLVAKLFGPVFSVISGGVGTLLVVAGIAYSIPELRRLKRLGAAIIEPPEEASLPQDIV